MTRDEIVTIIKQRMGNYNNSTLDAHIVTEMQLAQENLEQEAQLPWFLVETGEVAVTAGDRTFVPAAVGGRAFLAPFPDVPFYSWKTASETEADKIEIPTDDYKVAWNSYANTAATTKPLMIANDLSGLFTYALFPLTSVDVTVQVNAYYADAVLSTDVTNKWLTYAPEIMIGKVGQIIAGQYTVLDAFIPKFAANETSGRVHLAKRTVVWEENNIRRLMGDS